MDTDRLPTEWHDNDALGHGRPRPTATRLSRAWAIVISALLVLGLLEAAVLTYVVLERRDSNARLSGMASSLTSQQTTLKSLRSELGAVRGQAQRAEAAAQAAGADASDAKDSASKASDEASRTSQEQARAKAAALDAKSVSDKALPSIVTVHCGNSLGSGFAIKAESPSGYRTSILTNEHVVDDCAFGLDEAYATQGSTTFDGVLGEVDADNDLAILHIKAQLDPLEVASSASVGDPVAAIGSPYGLEGTVTTGIISRVEDDWYQTSALINHGNSGGPLLDRRGEVLGVNTIDAAGGGSGLGGSIRFRVVCEVIAPSACQ